MGHAPNGPSSPTQNVQQESITLHQDMAIIKSDSVPGTQMSSGTQGPRDPVKRRRQGCLGSVVDPLVWERRLRSSLGSSLGSNRPTRLTNVQFNIVPEDLEPARARLRQESYFIGTIVCKPEVNIWSLLKPCLHYLIQCHTIA